MGEPRGYYTKSNKSEKTNIVLLSLYVLSKKQTSQSRNRETQRSNWCLPEGVVYKTGEGD